MRLLGLFCCLGIALFAQSYKPIHQSDPKLNLDTVLAGVKHIVTIESEEYQKSIDAGEEGIYQKAMRNYLDYLGFESIGITSREKQQIDNSIQSECDKLYFKVGWDFNDSSRIVLTLSFVTCTKEVFRFETIYSNPQINSQFAQKTINDFLSKWKQMYRRKPIKYDVKHRLSLPKLPTNWTEASLKQYFTTSSIDSVEGIYERIKMSAEDEESKYKIAVVKTDNLSYNILYLGGANCPDDWQEGEIKAVLFKSAIPNYYKVDWYRLDKKLDKDVLLQRTNEGLLEFKFTYDKSSYLKTFPVKW